MSAKISQFEWLIVVLVYNHQYYDDINSGRAGYITMEDQKKTLFQSIEGIQFNNKIKVILVENRLQFEQTAYGIGVSETVGILEKTAHPQLQPFSITRQTQGVLTDDKKIRALLQEIKSAHPSKRHILITFGHGSIFGINYIVSPNSLQLTGQHATATGTPVNSTANYPVTKYYRCKTLEFMPLSREERENFVVEGSFDYKAFFASRTRKELNASKNTVSREVMLTNAELKKGIKGVIKKKKLDILVMYNCIMQNIYTQYELKDCVEYLVAPVSGICQPGYNYAGVLEDLSMNFFRSNEYVAGLFVDTIRTNKLYDDFKSVIEGTWKICSVKLDSKVYEDIKTSFAALIKEMNVLLNGTSPSIVTCLDSTLNECFNYAGICLNNEQSQIDLFVFLTYLSNKIKTEFPISLINLVPFIDKVIKNLSMIKCKSFIGKEFFSRASFADPTYKDEFGFGFLLQQRTYPADTIQNETLSSSSSPYFPAFLQGTDFEAMFSSYVGKRHSIPIEID